MSGDGSYGKTFQSLSTWTFARKSHLEDELRRDRLKKDLEEKIKHNRVKFLEESSQRRDDFRDPVFGIPGHSKMPGQAEPGAATKLDILKGFEEFRQGECVCVCLCGLLCIGVCLDACVCVYVNVREERSYSPMCAWMCM